jgi:hypothetical protein
LNIRNIKDNEFDGTINISSNIKDNKNTIIGKFDLRELLFLLIAGVVGIIALSILIAVLGIKNVFVVFIVLAVLEIPIITLGFLKLYNIPAIDYIKMKAKSDNSIYRKQVRKVKNDKKNKYLMAFAVEYNLEKLEEVINDVHSFIPFIKIEIEIIFNMIYLIIDVQEDYDINYSNFFDYLRVRKDILYVSYEDIKNYEIYIKSLKFIDKKYAKNQLKEIDKKKVQLDKIKPLEESNDKYNYLTNRIIESKENEFIKVYKFILYEAPLDLNVFNELKDICDITIHIDLVTDENGRMLLANQNYMNTFISIGARETRPYDVAGARETRPYDAVGASYASPTDLDSKVKEVLGKYQILYKEIREEKVKDSLLFLMENSY